MERESFRTDSVWEVHDDSNPSNIDDEIEVYATAIEIEGGQPRVKDFPVPLPSTNRKPGYVLLDSGCGAMMMGDQTLEAYREKLEEMNFPLVRAGPVFRRFRFGNDGVAVARVGADIPVCFEDCFSGVRTQGYLQAWVVPGTARFLVSKPLPATRCI